MYNIAFPLLVYVQDSLTSHIISLFICLFIYLFISVRSHLKVFFLVLHDALYYDDLSPL